MGMVGVHSLELKFKGVLRGRDGRARATSSSEEVFLPRGSIFKVFKDDDISFINGCGLAPTTLDVTEL